MSTTNLELWQTEWCPASHRVRQRLTELGLSYLTRQVPVEREARSALVAATGSSEIPVLVDAGRPVRGERAILDYLHDNYAEPPDACEQRAKASELTETAAEVRTRLERVVARAASSQ